MFISVNCFFLPFLFLFLLLFFFLFSHLIHGRVTNPAKLKLREKKRTKKTGKKIMEESKTRKETSCNNNTVWNECRRKQRLKEPRNCSYNKIRILISWYFRPSEWFIWEKCLNPLTNSFYLPFFFFLSFFFLFSFLFFLFSFFLILTACRCDHLLHCGVTNSAKLKKKEKPNKWKSSQSVKDTRYIQT